MNIHRLAPAENEPLRYNTGEWDRRARRFLLDLRMLGFKRGRDRRNVARVIASRGAGTAEPRALVPRPRQRVSLEAGLKLDLNKLMRDGCVKPGFHSAFTSVRTDHYGNETGRINFTCNMSNRHECWLRIQMDAGPEQNVTLTPRARSFGGHQWYFVCPVENRCCSVLWMPPGATHFRCRQGWGRRVAYTSQFLDPDNRAHRGQAKIKARLIVDLDPDEWELPPKPKWMRWRPYNRYVERFDKYETILDDGLVELIAKFLGK